MLNTIELQVHLPLPFFMIIDSYFLNNLLYFGIIFIASVIRRTFFILWTEMFYPLIVIYSDGTAYTHKFFSLYYQYDV